MQNMIDSLFVPSWYKVTMGLISASTVMLGNTRIIKRLCMGSSIYHKIIK